jgi:hypothetical protein
MSISLLDLVQLFEQCAGIEFSIVFCPEPLNGFVDAFIVGSAQKLCQFSHPIHV